MKRFKRIIAAIVIGSVCSVSSCVRDVRAIINPQDDPCVSVAGFETCWSEGI